MKDALNIHDLHYYYRGADKPLISKLNLSVKMGCSFGLFGPNGAGKTTLISLIIGVLECQQGEICLMGKDLHKHRKSVRSKLGYVPQNLSFYEELSPIQNLQYFGAMMGLSPAKIASRTGELMKILGLEQVAKKPVKQFSGGMKRRVNLAIGVVHQPEVLFLDEPTVGVDVQTRHAIITYLRELNENGTTLFYTSHHLSEAQELCETIALMDDGKIIAEGNLNSILEDYRQNTLEQLFLKLTGKQYRD